MTGAVPPFQRLKARPRRARADEPAKHGGGSRQRPARVVPPSATDGPHFPKWQRELFKTILEEENLVSDRDGRPRTAYSLRHTYICLRLMEGADIYQIAKNCHTSIEMIEKYYAAHIKTNLDAASINIMRPKPNKTQKNAKQSGSAAPPQAVWPS
jgi:integrase